jgi:hypothetical protein
MPPVALRDSVGIRMTRSEAGRGGSARRYAASVLVLGGAVAVVAAALFAESRGWLSAGEGGAGRPLTQPLRLAVASPDSVGQLLLGLRIHHYRPQPRGQSRFREVFYDTRGWDLYRHGYSYRFRTRLEGSGGSKYSLRLEQEPRFVPPGSTKLDLAADLPDEAGAAIEAGAWERAVLAVGVEPAERLRAVLRELGVGSAEAVARLVAEQRRERFDVSDKGQDWFELDHEAWAFRPFDATGDAPAVAFEDVVIDTRLDGQDRELHRRVRTMRQLVRMIHGFRPLELAPHERAIEALGPRD